ncbi:RtcB family protein [Caldiplasma sukawensis]
MDIIKEEELKSTYLIRDNGREARVIMDENEIFDYKTRMEIPLNQLLSLSEFQGLVGLPLGLPDIHQGYGFPIGSVAAYDQYSGVVIPGGVGYDINCGVSIVNTHLKKEQIGEKLKHIGERILKEVPVGMARSKNKINFNDLSQILTEGLDWMIEKYPIQKSIKEKSEENGSIKDTDISKISETALKRGINYFATLGSGNHFIEIGEVDEAYDESLAEHYNIEKGDIYVMVHCGSRGLGHQIASEYIQKAIEKTGNMVRDKQMSFIPMNDELSLEYINAMNCAANYSFVNRQFIIEKIMEIISKFSDQSEIQNTLLYSISHNIARFEDVEWEGKRIRSIVHRKGATRAMKPSESHFGGDGFPHPVIVPGSMGTESFILCGKEDQNYRYMKSSCHGSGRKMGRKEAENLLSVEKEASEMNRKNIMIFTPTGKFPIDEASPVYKDPEIVVRLMEDAGVTKKVVKLKPMAAIKG